MTSEKLDRRVKYTKKVLKESLVEILEKKNIDKITIKEICEKADINRSTFYTHYYDQYDLLHQIENEYPRNK
jgi:AcrR family transcriptional regulator